MLLKLIGVIAVLAWTASGAVAGDFYPPTPAGPCGPQPCAPPQSCCAPPPPPIPVGPCGPQPCAPPPQPCCAVAPPQPCCAAALPVSPCCTPPPPCCGWIWTGFYGGANLGFQWGTLSNSGAKPSGLIAGFQSGYNWQFGQWVTGFETDIQLSDANDVFANYKFSNPWFGTVRGRAGFAVNNLLFYGTFGLAYGLGRVDLGGVTQDNMHVGWTTGVGLEAALWSNWSVKAEYLFVDLGSANYSILQTNLGLTSNVARFGLNYHF